MSARIFAYEFLLLPFCCWVAGCSQVPEPSLTETEIVGRIEGHDGQPMAKARALLALIPMKRPLDSVEADEDGRFRVSTNKTGVILLQLSGVHHDPEIVSIFVEKPERIQLEVRLSTAKYKEPEDKLSLRTHFPDNDEELDGSQFVQQADGTYLFEGGTEKSQVGYTVGGIRDPGGKGWFPLIEGTDQQEFYVNPSNFFAPFYSLAHSQEGKLQIRFDPAALPQSETPAEVRFIDAGEERVRFHQIMSRIIYRTWKRFEEGRVEWKRQQKLAAEAAAAGEEYIPTSRLPDPPQASEIEALIRQIETEDNLFLKRALLMDYLRLTPWQLKADSQWVARALDEIGAESPLWWWQMSDAWELANRVGDAIGETPDPKKYQGYWFRIIDNLPEERWVANFYAVSFDIAHEYETKSTGDAEGVSHLQLDKDFIAQKAMALDPDHPAVIRYVKTYLDQVKMVGQQVPNFSVPTLEDPSVFYTPENIQAKIYLLDFWATWCGPCLEQFPFLHRLYEQYSGQGFEILSYSADSSAEVVQSFRQGRWPLPWLNSIEPGKGIRSDIGRAFKLVQIPKTFLVREGGDILAVDPSEEELERLLKQELG